MRAARLIVLATAATAGTLLASGSARAHDLNATVKVGADGIRVEVFFEEVVPAEFATVSVSDANGSEVVAGTTDANGVWTFPAPAPGEYLLTAKCIGHVAKVKFSIAGTPPVPEAPPVSYTGYRLNKAVGLTVGVGGLLGASALLWLFRRRRE